MSVFDAAETPSDLSSWRPSELPLIKSKGIKEVEIDTEGLGLDWFQRDVMGGISYCLPDATTGYLPMRHRGGNNLDEAQVKRWAQGELRDVHITNLNMRFDVHVFHRWGVDLEAQGCTVSSVDHFAALLDDHRQKHSLESLCIDYLKEERKVLSVFGQKLDGTRMMEYPAAMVAVRAEADVRQVHMLKKVLLPLLAEQDLMRVKDLEDRVIYPVCEMERNGSPINMPLLREWVSKIAAEIQKLREDLATMLGHEFQAPLFEGGKSANFLNPDSPKEMEALFRHLRLPIARTKTGRPSFTANVLKTHKGHPVIDRIIKLSKLLDLDNKYVSGTLARVSPDGIFRYALHQLRAQKDEHGDSGEAGTISGRFSSTNLLTDVGDNIQSRIKVAKQRVSFGYAEDDTSHDEEIYLIRRLHRPAQGMYHLSADAKQIEYRMFAHFLNDPAINEVYRQNPETSFHKYTHAKIKQFKADQTYRQQKDLNFAYVYGAGLKKMALMLGFITQEQFEELTESRAKKTHPLLQEAAKVRAIYDREIPGAAPLLRRASHLAMDHCNDYCTYKGKLSPLHYEFEKKGVENYGHRGYVRTILGRRARFPDNYKSHKAFNSVDQGSSADIMKMKIVELHNRRHETGFVMRYVVHDEFDGDIPDIECAKKVRAILDEQSFPLNIPILWDVSIGEDWAECGADSASIDEIKKHGLEGNYARKQTQS